MFGETSKSGSRDIRGDFLLVTEMWFIAYWKGQFLPNI